MKKIYLDMCALKRPFDHPGSDRVLLEALAVAALLGAVEDGRVEVVSSASLELENSRNPDGSRREAVQDILLRLSRGGRVGPSKALASRAAEIHSLGFNPLDALHLSSAELAGCDLFVSCDDRLLRLARRIADRLGLDVADPTEAVRLLERGEEG